MCLRNYGDMRYPRFLHELAHLFIRIYLLKHQDVRHGLYFCNFSNLQQLFCDKMGIGPNLKKKNLWQTYPSSSKTC